MSSHRGAVALVVLAQWLGTSLWFSPSGAADGLMAQFGIGAAAFGWLKSTAFELKSTRRPYVLQREDEEAVVFC